MIRMRPIDADSLLKYYDLENADKYSGNGYETLMKYEVADLIYDAPTLDVEIVKHDGCSYCETLDESPDAFPIITDRGKQYVYSFRCPFKYCPYCGRKLRE